MDDGDGTAKTNMKGKSSSIRSLKLERKKSKIHSSEFRGVHLYEFLQHSARFDCPPYHHKQIAMIITKDVSQRTADAAFQEF